MSSKRPSTKACSTTDEWRITDEWGLYDPEKAGIPALFARLGRPMLRAAPTSSSKERRRALRPAPSTEGIGPALAEARRRAGCEAPEDGLEHPLVKGNSARAMRLALRAQAAVNAMGTPAAEARETPAPKGRIATRTGRARPATDAPTRHIVPAPESKPHVAPASPPRRPRGPVPLAAWAHAVADQPKVEPRRADKRGFWRGIFRMPAEVALIEYAHGAKIHRLRVEAGDEQLPDFIQPAHQPPTP